jgi:Flp pilus assembly protein TadG
MSLLAKPASPRARRRSRRSPGQALVEFAAFFVFIMLLVAGVVDIGGLLDDHVSIEYATRQGARTAAVLGTQSVADCAIIGAINAAVANMPNMRVTQIIIYKSGANGLPLGSSSETIYPGNTICTVSGSSYTLSQVPTLNNYPPANRSNLAFTEDSVGIELDYTYTFQLPILGGGTFSAADRAIMPVSPITVPTPGS